MGRSRAPRVVDDQSNQSKSKRKKVALNAQNVGTTSTVPQETSNEISGKPPSYHCNYCNKDISGVIRIKCAVCPDFDLCIECFSVGAEVYPHKSDHCYKVMDDLSFPLICLDWNADEEILLLEGIEMYGIGNWAEVAEHVGTKSKVECIDHYNTIYMNSTCFPAPDMSHIVGKRRDELLAMAKDRDMVKPENPSLEKINIKEESTNSGKIIGSEVPRKKDSASVPSPTLAAESGYDPQTDSRGGKTIPDAIRRATNVSQYMENIKVEESPADRSIGEKKPRSFGDKGPSVTELSGYNAKRHEFEVEYDNDAEQILADMEFKDTDTDAEHKKKLQVLQIYNKRLDERKRRKDFVLERNLLNPDPLEKELSAEEKEIYERHKVFSRYLLKEEHAQLVKSIIEEHRIIRRIEALQEARAAGCQTSTEVYNFIQQKKNKEAAENAQRLKENVQTGFSGKSPRGMLRGSSVLHNSDKGLLLTTASLPSQTILSLLDDWDISGFPGADLLTEHEKSVCAELRILPTHYMNMLQTLSVEITEGRVKNKADAHSLFKVEASKIDKVYDMLVKKGVALA